MFKKINWMTFTSHEQLTTWTKNSWFLSLAFCCKHIFIKYLSYLLLWIVKSYLWNMPVFASSSYSSSSRLRVGVDHVEIKSETLGWNLAKSAKKGAETTPFNNSFYCGGCLTQNSRSDWNFVEECWNSKNSMAFESIFAF